MSTDLLKDVPNKQPSSLSVEGIGGHRLSVPFTAVVPITVGPTTFNHRVLAVKGFSPKCLLGSDALLRLQADISFKSQQLCFSNSRVPMRCLHTAVSIKYVLGDQVTLMDPTFDVKRASVFIESFRQIFTDKSKPMTVAHGLKPMRIDLINEAQPKYHKPYRKTPDEDSFVDTSVEVLLQNELVEDCEGPWASSTVVAYNSDNTKMKLVIDYVWLNKFTVSDKFPLPTWKDIKLVIAGAVFISKIDLRAAYHQCPLRKQDRHKTAFVTRNRHLQWKVVPMGLRNAPAYFQHLMNELLRGIPGVVVFLDDIGIFTKTVDEHFKAIEQVFSRLHSVGLRVSEEKCQFFMSSLTFLGVVVSRDGLSPDPAKLSGISKIGSPSSKKDLRSFLGLCLWFSEHVCNLAQWTGPLSDLLADDIEWRWTFAEQRLFETVKQVVVNRALTLSFPDFKHQFVLQTDGSSRGIGAMLYQQVHGKTKVISCISRKLKPAERNYSAAELEVLAVVWSLEKFREYLFRRPFLLRTDHKALTSVEALAKDHGRLARWKCLLRMYDYIPEHVPGRENLVADALSRLETADDNAGSTPTDPFSSLLVGVSQTDWAQAQRLDEDCVKLRSKLSSFPSFEVVNGLLAKRQFNRRSSWSALVVPVSLRRQVLSECHEHPAAAHQGVEKTYLRVHQSYFWNGMYQDVKTFVQSCDTCQRSKRFTSPAVPLGEVQADFPLQKVAMDIIELPESENKYSYVLVVADLFTRYVSCTPLHRMTTDETIQAFMSSWVSNYGVPHQLLTDQGSNFSSKLAQDVFRFLQIKKLWTTAYHPQTDGCVERFNRSLIKMLRAFSLEHQDSWDLQLPLVTHAYNTAIHSVTGYSPYFLMFGREPPTSVDSLVKPPSLSSLPDYVKQQQHALQETFLDLREANADRSQNRSDKNDKLSPLVFHPGQLVLLNDDTKPAGVAGKLLPRWRGPFRVIRKLSDLVYALEYAPDQERIVNTCKLKPYFVRESQPASKRAIVPPVPAAPDPQHPAPPAAVRSSQRISKTTKFPGYTVYRTALV